jgi:hypothetical protein
LHDAEAGRRDAETAGVGNAAKALQGIEIHGNHLDYR